MYSSCAHCKQNFFHQSECCWTYRTLAPRRSKCFNENTLTFSHSTVRIKLKFLYDNIQSCNKRATTMKFASIDKITIRTTHFRKLPQPSRVRSTSHKAIYTARQWLRLFLYHLYNFLLYRVTQE